MDEARAVSLASIFDETVSTGEAERIVGYTRQTILRLIKADPSLGFRPHPRGHWRVRVSALSRFRGGSPPAGLGAGETEPIP